MQTIRSGSIKDLIWNFAVAEFEPPDDGQRHTLPSISPDLLDRVLKFDRDSFTKDDWFDLFEAVWSTRAHLLGPAATQVDDWFIANLTSSDWDSIHVLNLRIFAQLAPTLRLAEFVESLDRGTSPATWDPRMYRRRRASFDLARMHGLPILVSDRTSGPYQIIEGTTRLSILASKRASKQLVVPNVQVLLGIGRPFDNSFMGV